MSEYTSRETWELAFTDEDPPVPFVCTPGDVVCIPDHNHTQPDHFDYRNFRLIAAAPDLLAAIEEIMDYRGGAESALEDTYVMERVAAAITKATTP